ncbi:MAG: carboxypeptidase-like regulatory domain-containing protein [Flavobacteriales bacterium]|nr:carboxypeptidase-like regulatory domain-containing protein [Flavobacteriales bacterium]
MNRNTGAFLFLIWLSFLDGTIYAQELTQIVRGSVLDQDSKIPLIGATVFIVGTDPILGASTDLDGRFTITGVPVGRHDLAIQYLGYEPKSIPQVDVGSGKEVVLKVEMTESTEKLAEVVITGDKKSAEANNEMALVSTRSFSLEQSERFAASMNDPGRMALSFAGVNLTDDVTNEISIRGNSPKGLLWRLEGVEVPVPNHFNIEGLYAGNVSILSNNLLDRSDFSTGAFPAEYGNALSGVYDLRLRTGNDQKREYTVQVGFMGLEASAEGPFLKGKRASYLVNYRYSTLGLFKAVGANLGGDLNTGFQDLNLKLNFPTKKLGTFSAFLVGGLSEAGFTAERDSSKWSNGWDQHRVEEDYRNHFVATGIGHRFIINEQNYIHTTLAYTQSGNNLLHSYLTDSLQFLDFWNYNVYNRAIRLSTQFNTKFNSKHNLRYGFNYNRLMFSLEDRWIEGWGDFYRAKGEANFYQIYAQHRYRINANITLIAGIHASYFDVNGKLAFEPRLAFDWRFAPNHKLSLGFGMHSRQESLAFYFVEDGNDSGTINRYLDYSRALHVVLSYDYQILKNLNLHTELYYQYLYGIPVRIKPNAFSSINDNEAYEKRALVNDGLGTNYGLELTLEKSFSKNYYVLLTGSLYNSIYQGSDKVWRNTKYNGNYITSLTAGKDFRVGKKGKNVIGLNIKFFYAGGRRVTPIDLDASIEEGNEVLDESRILEGRAPDYFRLDARLHFKHNLKKIAWEVSIDIQNTTNRKNVIKEKYNPNTESIEFKYQQGIIPVLKLRVEF